MVSRDDSWTIAEAMASGWWLKMAHKWSEDWLPMSEKIGTIDYHNCVL